MRYILAAVVISLSFTACDNEKEETTEGTVLEGKWSHSERTEYDNNGYAVQAESFTFKGNTFITVATLNEAKGVERLPAFFREYGKYVDDYFWIVIGNGAKADELSQGLADLDGHVLRFNVNIDNADIIRLYDKMDFYILAHRYSIFDYATIEAMHMGCIPVLTPVGGNLEMITEDNGYFLDDSLNAENFVKWVKLQDIAKLKELNHRIAGKKFSEYSMLKAYKELLKSF